MKNYITLNGMRYVIPCIQAFTSFELIINDYNGEYITRPCECYAPRTLQNIRTKNIREIFENYDYDLFKYRSLLDMNPVCEKCNKTNLELKILDPHVLYLINKLPHIKNIDDVRNTAMSYLNIGLSSKCNIACKTCRDTYITKEYDIPDEDIQYIFNQFPRFFKVGIGTAGEIFASDIYRKFYSSDIPKYNKNIRIILYTNGTLMNDTNLKKIHQNNWPNMFEFKISIDAACEETYKKVRNDKLWNALIANIKNLVENYKSKYHFITSSTFTISKYNVQDVPLFVDFCKDLGFNDIYFQFARPKLHDKSNTSFIIPLNERKDICEFIANEKKNKSNNDFNIYSC